MKEISEHAYSDESKGCHATESTAIRDAVPDRPLGPEWPRSHCDDASSVALHAGADGSVRGRLQGVPDRDGSGLFEGVGLEIEGVSGTMQ